jgi:hypothetical protein
MAAVVIPDTGLHLIGLPVGDIKTSWLDTENMSIVVISADLAVKQMGISGFMTEHVASCCTSQTSTIIRVSITVTTSENVKTPFEPS